jgi:hypothetical protein
MLEWLVSQYFNIQHICQLARCNNHDHCLEFSFNRSHHLNNQQSTRK